MTPGPEKKRIAVGARIRELRKGLTQAQFAEMVGVAQGQVAKYEKGMMPGPAVLLNISRAMGVTIEWILCGEEENLPGRGLHTEPQFSRPGNCAAAGDSRNMLAQVREMRDPMDTAPAREAGGPAGHPIEDQDQAGFAAGHIMDTKLPRYEAGLIGDLIRDAVRDREIRDKLISYYLFLRFQQENEPKGRE